MKRLLSALAVAAVHFNAHAQEPPAWEPYGATGDAEVFWRPGTVKKTEQGTWEIWTKELPSKPVAIDRAKPNGPKYTHALSLMVVSCKFRSLGLSRRYEYGASGNVLGSAVFPLSLSPAIPESIGEALVETACTVLDK